MFPGRQTHPWSWDDFSLRYANAHFYIIEGWEEGKETHNNM
jgi:hypothetical protein